MTVLIEYPKQTKKKNKVFFEKKDQELTNLDWSQQGGWFDTDGTFTHTYAKEEQRWKKRADLKLKDRQPVELFSKTFETSLTDYLSKTITPEPYKKKYTITMHQAILREEKAEWFTKNVYPYLIKQEKKDYAAKLLGYRPESKDFADWTPEEVIHYLATAVEGDGHYGLDKRGKNTGIYVKLISRDVQYLSDVINLVDDKLGKLFSGISEKNTYTTKDGEEHLMYTANGYGSLNHNLDIFQSLVKDGLMTLDRKKQRVQEFLGQEWGAK
jgi:hypothetical protein